MTNTKHTPTPWKVEEQDTFAVVVGNDGKEITSSYDRDHAIKCVNLHDELVAVMSDIHDFLKRSGYDTTMVKEALKKAGAL